jgi:hypothetical protein
MDKLLDERLQNIEEALNAVIDSTTQYNPSPQDAEKLLQADDDLDVAVATRSFFPTPCLCESSALTYEHSGQTSR